MLKQLTAMVAKMGDLGGAAEAAAAAPGDAGVDSNAGEDGGKDGPTPRPVVRSLGRNVSDLVEVMCSPGNADLFLKFGADDVVDNDAEDKDKGDEDEMFGDDEKTKNEDDKAEDGNEEAAKKKKIVRASEEAGPLASLLSSCAHSLPLQTPSYAALALGVDVRAPAETHGGFAGRCVDAALRRLGRDIDEALECCSKPEDDAGANGANNSCYEEEEGVEERRRCLAERSGGCGAGNRVDAYHRAKLTLRYLAHLARIGIVNASTDENDEEGLSLLGLLRSLADAASNANTAAAAASSDDEKYRGRASKRASQLLASLVLSTVPYAVGDEGGQGGVPAKALSDLVDLVERTIVAHTAGYASDYEPGSGSQAILLRGELDDAPVAGGGDDDEEEEEDDDDDDDDEEPAPVCADTLQDLLRTVRKVVTAAAASSSDGSSTSVADATRFALLDDAPWSVLTTTTTTTVAGDDEMEDADGEGTTTTTTVVPMAYEGKPIKLDLTGGGERRCRSLPYLLSLGGSDGVDGSIEIRCRSLDGIVFGRLNIFEAPSDPSDEDDDEEEEGGESGAADANPDQEAYAKTYSLADRFFLADAVRDVLLCHRPMVNDGGADRSSARDVAEQIWAVSHLFRPASGAGDAAGEDGAVAAEGTEPQAQAPSSNSLSPSKGIEYGIIESLLSLIVQSTPHGSVCPSSSPLGQHAYLSRVLLELTKLRPSLLPRAVAAAVSGMFEDFVPSLTPTARDNLAHWLAYHLNNTDYQWPKAYWDHWSPYATAGAGSSSQGGRNSRGEFVATALRAAAANSYDNAATVVTDCLPPGSSLVAAVFPSSDTTTGDDASCPAERDLIDRIWNANDDPESIRMHIIGDELSESFQGGDNGGTESNDASSDAVWWRTGLVVRAVLCPAAREKTRIERLVVRADARRRREAAAAAQDGMEDAVDADDGAMDGVDDVDESEDYLADVTDSVARFKPAILAAVARDAEAYQKRLTESEEETSAMDDDALLRAGEVSVLRQVGKYLSPRDDGGVGSATSTVVGALMVHRIVSGSAVVRWTLEGEGSGSGEDGATMVLPGWWKVASSAVRGAASRAILECDEAAGRADLGGGIGMIIDDGGAGAEEGSSSVSRKRLDGALGAVVPIVKHAAERVCVVLAAAKTSGDGTSKKISPVGADLAEGMKRLVEASLFHLSSLLAPSDDASSSNVGGGIDGGEGPSEGDIAKGFAKLGASGAELASLCRINADSGGDNAKILQTLAQSLENIL